VFASSTQQKRNELGESEMVEFKNEMKEEEQHV
jgi:hypothetical protein